ncbi:pentatricopeptide repeat-containing protein, mitochondrial [Cocos nucifera]|uniref:Pentatricopeptide repeat-containing protein, mitochondrial n=1 Tax=Cocos nucifera TaxID=13894 RepID=A0A8K0N588_COCNU|nr:pentatricopeptide repeat-containing protein, mitochondrial [Cocos nucifera]
MWMSDRRYFPVTPGDLAYRLQLINKVHGLEHTENYFNNISSQLKLYQPYGALLKCYAEEKSVEKAEALFEKMKESNMLSSFGYNMLMKLYSDIGELGKIDATFQEMEEKGILPNFFTYNILMEAYANTCNINGMEKILKRMRDPEVPANWHIYAVAAKGYVKIGLMDKALAALKKSEKRIPQKKGRVAYGFILSVYADIGNKDEVHRVWNSCKAREKLSNSMYMCMISALLKLDDIEGAEAILKEWEAQFDLYDFRVPNLLIGAYCTKGLLGKAESLVGQVIESGRTPLANTWDRLAGGYFREGQTLKAVEMMKKALQMTGQTVWKPNPANVLASLEYFRDQKDVEAAEEFVTMLRHLVPLTRENYLCLLRTYLLAGKPVTDLLQQMKEDGLDVDDETQKILEEKNNQCHPESSC